jgi:hypothetical protein
MSVCHTDRKRFSDHNKIKYSLVFCTFGIWGRTKVISDVYDELVVKEQWDAGENSLMSGFII